MSTLGQEGKRKPLVVISNSPRKKSCTDLKINSNASTKMMFPRVVVQISERLEKNSATDGFVARVNARKPSMHLVVKYNLEKSRCFLTRLKERQTRFRIDPCLRQVLKIEKKSAQELSQKFSSHTQFLLSYTFE
jgi:hypothetical protein